MTTTTGANANDSTRAASDTARGSKQQTITGAIKALFRSAVKALTEREDEDEEPQEKRRKGETEGEFQRFGRWFRRRYDARRDFRGRASIAGRDTIPGDVFATAASYARTAFDQLSELNDDPGFIEDHGESLDGPKAFLSLDL